MTTIKATIKGRRLELDVPADWPDGTEVEVVPVSAIPTDREGWRRFIERTAGSIHRPDFYSPTARGTRGTERVAVILPLDWNPF